MLRRLVVVAIALMCIPIGAARAVADSGSAPKGDISSADATTVLAALGITPAQFEATSNGVSLAQLQQQLDAMHAGLPIPNFAMLSTGQAILLNTLLGSDVSPEALRADSQLTPSSQPPDTCGAVGSKRYTPSVGTGGLRGYERLGFLMTCTVPRNSISSACTLTAIAGRNQNTGNNSNGGRNCSTATAVGSDFRRTKGTYEASWGAYNKIQPFVALPGCIADGHSAICAYKTTFRVGDNSKSFALTPTG